jgi:hypothetical protein
MSTFFAKSQRHSSAMVILVALDDSLRNLITAAYILCEYRMSIVICSGFVPIFLVVRIFVCGIVELGDN